MKQYIAQFDSSLTHLVQSMPQSLSPLMYSLSFIGRPVFTIALLVAMGIFAIVQHQFRLVIAVLVAGATFATNSLIKIIIHRPRPDSYHSENVLLKSYSFPSGHAASSVVIFGLLAYVLWRTLPHPWNYIAAIFLTIFIFGIGVSRIYIGAHYPSDVVAGWIVGLIGLAIIIWLIRPL